MDTKGAPRVSGNGRTPRGRALLSAEGWHLIGRQLELSPRELEVVQQIFEGKKLAVIARDMNLGLGTVKTYSQRIHQKLEVTDQRELALAVFGAYLNLAPKNPLQATS